MNDTQAQTRQLQAHCAEAFEPMYRGDPELGTQVDHVAGATVFRWPAMPIPLFNRAIGLGDTHQPDDAEIDQVLGLYRDAEIEGYIQLSPLADREALGRRLVERGLEPRPSYATLALTPDHWQPATPDPAITIESVDDQNRDDFVRVLLEAFQLPSPADRFLLAAMVLPEVQNFLVRHEGEPAGTGQIVVAAEVGGLYSGGVLERFRRRGIQAALIDHRAQAAFDQGLQLLYSGTEEVDNQSSRNLRKRGFFIAYELVNWALPAR